MLAALGVGPSLLRRRCRCPLVRCRCRRCCCFLHLRCLVCQPPVQRLQRAPHSGLPLAHVRRPAACGGRGCSSAGAGSRAGTRQPPSGRNPQPHAGCEVLVARCEEISHKQQVHARNGAVHIDSCRLAGCNVQLRSQCTTRTGLSARAVALNTRGTVAVHCTPAHLLSSRSAYVTLQLPGTNVTSRPAAAGAGVDVLRTGGRALRGYIQLSGAGVLRLSTFWNAFTDTHHQTPSPSSAPRSFETRWPCCSGSGTTGPAAARSGCA